MRSIALALAALLALAAPVAAEDIKVVRHVTESWGGFTNRDGTGLYHELFKAVFGEFGVAVEIDYVPLKRAVAMVESNAADMTGGFNRDARNFARYPVFETNVSALFFRDTIPDWKGPESLDGLRIVGPPELAKASGLPVLEVDSREQAAMMMLRGRAAAYLDLSSILEDFRETGRMIASDQTTGDALAGETIDRERLALEVVNLTQLYMLFADTERGRRVRAMYEEGTRRLKRDGRLDALYARYGFQTPTVELD